MISALQHPQMTSGTIRTTVAGGALAAAALLFTFDPAATWWFPSCPLNALTGWLCPFCGSLRAWHALLHGDLHAAWTFNPLTMFATAIVSIAVVLDAMGAPRTSCTERLFSSCVSARGLVFAAAFGVLRNLPDPFGWLMR
jgi:hypothetical protein